MTLIKDIKFTKGEELELNGWIFTSRKQSDTTFINLMDGTTPKMVQCVMPTELVKSYSLTSGTSISVKGVIDIYNNKPELKVSSLKVLGECEASKYPIAKAKLGVDYLRKFEHLRIRTHLMQAVMRVRHTLSMGIHNFFDERGYIYTHTPLLTSNDCEGAGETFNVISQDPFKKKEGKPSVIYANKELFKKPVFLTVSGQLHGESYACGLNQIYTFGPTFRAEKSDSSRHLSEFWMVEPEVCFITQEELHQLSQELIQYCIKKVLKDRKDDLIKLSFLDKELVSRLESFVSKDFPRVSYDEAVEILLKSDKKFENPVSWGIDFSSEHEKYLAEEVYKHPIICYNYPKAIKSFYMKANDDERTVQSMDLLVPNIGELIGGSIREESYDKLKGIMESKGIKNLDWYLDLRKYGTVPHGGFGLGFERMVLLCTGMKNIRDVIPYPRYTKHCEC